MKICVIGMNLTSLILSKALVNSGLIVHLFSSNKNYMGPSTRTIGVSKSNVNFINKNIIDLKTKKLHDIKKISILSEKKNEIIKFYNKGENLFSLIEVTTLFNILYNKLKRDKLFKIKNSGKQIPKKNYELIINCEKNNKISRKYFSTKLEKSYNSFAYTTIIRHQNIHNTEAKQYFTAAGPLAFLPLSSKETSIVLSAYNNTKFNDEKLKKLIFKFSDNLKIKKFSEFQKAKLKYSLARKYYFKNILLFGDTLHQIHPLAGQGFNMTLRDLKILLKVINNRIDNGLEINASCLEEFEKIAKPKNFLFSNAINFIEKFFRMKKNFGEYEFNYLIKKIGSNNKINNFFMRTADEGITTF